jgi:hypothetical protein
VNNINVANNERLSLLSNDNPKISPNFKPETQIMNKSNAKQLDFVKPRELKQLDVTNLRESMQQSMDDYSGLVISELSEIHTMRQQKGYNSRKIKNLDDIETAEEVLINIDSLS